MLQHYFHSSHNLRSKRQNLRPFRFTTKSNNNNNSTSHICLSNGNAIEIYRVSADSVDLCMRKQFTCNIVKVEVVPSLHHDSDYVFVLDDMGRYAFWRPGEEMRETSNVIMEEDTKQRYYREEMSPEEEEHFSGSTFRFDVKDTVGHIFFTIQNKLIILKLSVKVKQGLRIQNIRKYQIPYTRFRYVNCLKPFNSTTKDSQIIIGIVQQIQEKTVLKFHTLNLQVSSTLIDEESLSFKLQKVNILQFSSGENDEIIVLTYDQISLYRFKQTSHLCNYRTKGNYGSTCYVPAGEGLMSRSQAMYIHLGFEVIVFTKNKLRNYGGLRLDNKLLLENRGITESTYLGRNSNGQVELGFVSTFNQVYFVVLKDQRWNLLRKIDSLSSIFSITQAPSDQKKSNSPLVVVHSSSQSCSEVSLIQVTTPTVLQLQQSIQQRVIENICYVEEGQSLIVSHSGESSLLKWSKSDKRWVENYMFRQQNKQEVLACRGRYIVMRSGIYKYQQQSSTAQSLSTILLIKQSNILSAVCNDSYIGYYTSQGTYKFFQIKSQSIARVRKNCVEEYLWHMVEGGDVLVSAAYNQLGELRILAVGNVGRKVTLDTKQLVSAIEAITYHKNNNKMVAEQQQIQHISNATQQLSIDLIIGFHNGQFEVYSLQHNRTVAKFTIGDEMVRITPYRKGHVVVYTSQRQFILSREVDNNSNNSNRVEYKLHQVQFTNNDNQSMINQLLYLPKFDNFLISIIPPSTIQHSLTLLQLRSLKLSSSLSNQQFSLQLSSSLSLKTLFKAESNDIIPFTEIYNSQYLFIAVSENLFKYSLKTKSLVKQQLHLIKQIIAINSLSSGIIVVGVDFMQSGSIYIFDYQDLSIKSTYNMGSGAKPSCLQTFTHPQSDRFLIRYQTLVSIFELQPNGIITLINSTNTKTQGSIMQLNQQYNKILLTDPYRYLSVWDYNLQKKDMLPVSKYFGPCMINDTVWLDGAVVTGDRGGNLTLLEFNLDNANDLHKMTMTKVGQISIGEEVFTLTASHSQKHNKRFSQSNYNKLHQMTTTSTIYYGTSGGTIGSIKTISQEQFKLLKQIQLDCIKYIDLKQHFSYQQWRKRSPLNDKLIDGCLIKYYLQEFRNKIKPNQEQFYHDVEVLYKSIIERKTK